MSGTWLGFRTTPSGFVLLLLTFSDLFRGHSPLILINVFILITNLSKRGVNRFAQNTSVCVEPDATLIYGELNTPGRVARGESLAYDCWQSRLTVSRPDGCPVYHEAFSLEPGVRSPMVRNVLGEGLAPTLGTLLIVTSDVEAAALRDGLRERLNGSSGTRVDAQVGISTLPHGSGVGLKVLAVALESARVVLRTAWAEARRQILGAELPTQRKY